MPNNSSRIHSSWGQKHPKIKVEGKKIRLEPKKSRFGSFLPQNSAPFPSPLPGRRFWCKIRRFPSIPAAGFGVFLFVFWFFPENLGFREALGARGPGIAAERPKTGRDLGQKHPKMSKTERKNAIPAVANQYKPVWDWGSGDLGGSPVGEGLILLMGGDSQNSKGEPPKIPRRAPKFSFGGGGSPRFLGNPKIPRGEPQNSQGGTPKPSG